MSYRYDGDVEYEPDEPEAHESRWLPYAVVVMLALTGSASAFLWRTYGSTGFLLSYFASSQAADTGDKVVLLRDLQAFQQRIAARSQTATQELALQKAEIKRLSDQIAALNAKLDAVQNSASVHPPAPAPVAKPVLPPLVRKKPAVPKPAETSPTGGDLPQPLQLTR